MYQIIKIKVATIAAYRAKIATIVGTLIASLLLPYTTNADFGDPRAIQATSRSANVAIPAAPVEFLTDLRPLDIGVERSNFDTQPEVSTAPLADELEFDTELQSTSVDIAAAPTEALSRQMIGAERTKLDVQPMLSMASVSHSPELNVKSQRGNVEIRSMDVMPSMTSVPPATEIPETAAHAPSPAHAALHNPSGGLEQNLDRIKFDTPSLAPISFVRFCMRKPEDCSVQDLASHSGPVALTKSRMAELVKVNRDVNRAIRPKANANGVGAEEWLISPREGDCKDYAITKRHELLRHGWPSNSLLLAEVVVPSGEHHVVLVVRTREEDLVLDNLNKNVRPVSQVHYQWVRAQQTENPKFWSMISVTNAARVAMNAR